MPDVNALIQFETQHPNGQWQVHNGFFAYSYGTPQDPTPITRECAMWLLQIIEAKANINPLKELSKFPFALAYAEEGEELYKSTNNNRLIAFVPDDACIYIERSPGQTPRNWPNAC